MIARIAGMPPLLLFAASCVPSAAERAPVRAAIPPVAAPTPAAPVVQPDPAPVRFRFDGQFIQGAAVLGAAPTGTDTLTLDGEPVPVADDGAFLIAFDRDAGPQAMLVATLADGRVVAEPLTVAPRAWRIERLDRLPRISRPSAEFQRLRQPELARIRAARAKDTGAGGWRQRFVWPTTGRISGLFGAQRIYRGEPGSYHSGIDIARRTGTPVVAPADGIVILATDSEFTLEGRLLMIDHGMGLNSAFLHLSRIDVAEGDRVRQGQTVGAVGSSGRATGPHLHWSMKWNAARVDPLLIAGPMPDTE